MFNSLFPFCITAADQSLQAETAKPKTVHSRRLPSESSSIDSQNSINETTIMMPAAAPERHRAAGLPDEPLVCYPPTTSFGGDVPHGMGAVWPKHKKSSTVTTSALWPPGMSGNSRYSPSFDVISGRATTSGYDATGQGDPAFGLGHDSKEFAVQVVSFRYQPQWNFTLYAGWSLWAV